MAEAWEDRLERLIQEDRKALERVAQNRRGRWSLPPDPVATNARRLARVQHDAALAASDEPCPGCGRRSAVRHGQGCTCPSWREAVARAWSHVQPS